MTQDASLKPRWRQNSQYVLRHVCLQFNLETNVSGWSIRLKNVTFSEEDVSDGAVGVGGVLLHGSEGAPLCDLLHLSLRQGEAKEAADVTDAFGQVLQDGKQKSLKGRGFRWNSKLFVKFPCKWTASCLTERRRQSGLYLFQFFIGDDLDVGVVQPLLPGQSVVEVWPPGNCTHTRRVPFLSLSGTYQQILHLNCNRMLMHQ